MNGLMKTRPKRLGIWAISHARLPQPLHTISRTLPQPLGLALMTSPLFRQERGEGGK